MPTSTSGYRALRRGRVSNPGQAYLVTTVIKERAPVFADWDAASLACRTVSADFDDSRFLAWVVMPDHFHGLLLVGEQATLSSVMHRFKGRIARQLNERLGRAGPLWQPGFHDHALRKEEDLEPMARYIVENPVRAGLVARVGQYPYWNADWI